MACASVLLGTLYPLAVDALGLGKLSVGAPYFDAVMAPLVMWMKTHQPEVFDNPDTREKAIRFEAEFLNSGAVDLQIDLQLTEAVLSRARPNSPPGALNLIHKEEQPRPLTILQAERWEVWLRDEQLARWDYAPR